MATLRHLIRHAEVAALVASAAKEGGIRDMASVAPGRLSAGATSSVVTK